MLSMSAFSQPPCCSICFSTKLNRWLNLVLHPRKAVSGSISKWRARFTKVNNRSPSSSCWRSLLFEIANSAFNSSSSSFTLSNTPSILGQSNPTLLAFFCSFTARVKAGRSEEHTSELQSRPHLVCRLLLEKKKKLTKLPIHPQNSSTQILSISTPTLIYFQVRLKLPTLILCYTHVTTLQTTHALPISHPRF